MSKADNKAFSYLHSQDSGNTAFFKNAQPQIAFRNAQPHNDFRTNTNVHFRNIPPQVVDIRHDNQTNIAANSPNKGRVRLAAGGGDKCVAPNKSKPKKRRCLAPPDDSGLSMDCVEWSSRTYTVKQMVQQLGSKLPALVRVVEGYHVAEEGFDLGIGQVLQVHSFNEQDRIKARTTKGRLLSIPLNHQIEVKLEGHQETYELEEVVRRFPLPVVAEVYRVEQNAHGSLINLSGDTLHIIEKYEDLYLRANSINDGWIDQANIVVIPSFLEVIMSVALNMHGATTDEWEDYYSMFSRCVRHLNFKRVPGYSGAVSLDASNPRDSADVRVDLLPINESQYANTNPRTPSSPNSSRHVFTNRAFTPSPYSNDENGRRAVPPPNIPPPQPQTRPDEIYQNVRMASPKLPPKQKHLPPKRTASDAKLPVTSPKPNAESRQYRSLAHYKGYVANGTGDRFAGDGESGDELDVTEMFNSVIEVAVEEERKRTLEAERTPWQPTPNNRPTYPTYPTQDCYTRNATPAGHLRVKAEVNNTFERENNKRNTYQSHIEMSAPKQFRTIEDVPGSVQDLSVSEVCECLDLLSMSAHVAEFRRRNIDGSKLRELKDSTLQKNYGLNPFNASKLTRFVRGWRPNLI